MVAAARRMDEPPAEHSGTAGAEVFHTDGIDPRVRQPFAACRFF